MLDITRRKGGPLGSPITSEGLRLDSRISPSPPNRDKGLVKGAHCYRKHMFKCFGVIVLNVVYVRNVSGKVEQLVKGQDAT